jgi:L,D-transpeptidase catalytic domain
LERKFLPGSARRLELGTVEPPVARVLVAKLRPLGETVGLSRARIRKAASSRSRSGRTSLNRVRDPFISSPTTKTPFRARTRARRATQPSTIGTFVSSGCIRLTNEDVMDLYSRVRVGTRVVVLSGRPSTAAANSFTSPSAMPSGTVTAASPGPVSSPMAR